MDEKEKRSIIEAIIKRAVGYSSVESVEEMSCNDGELTLNKRKVTTKQVPPDPSAAKLIMGNFNSDPYESMDEKELLEAKRRLLEELDEDEEE